MKLHGLQKKSALFVFAVAVLSSAANAGGYVYVSPAGSDSNTCLTKADPCKTISHAVTLAPPGYDVAPFGGIYYENVRITKSGTSALPVRIINYFGDIFVDGSKGPATSSAIEVTGSHVMIAGVYFVHARNGIYVHGSDAFQHTSDVRFHYCGIDNNSMYNVFVSHSDRFEIGYGSIYMSGKEGIYLVDSPDWFIHQMGIYSSGSPPAAGTRAFSSPMGNYNLNANKKESGTSVNLVLNNSPSATVINNPPGSGGIFSYSVSPQSDCTTDRISNNGIVVNGNCPK